MKRLVITITNNISYDQRMLKVAQYYSTKCEVIILGSSTRNPPPLENQDFQQIRLKTFFKSGFLFYAEFNIRLLFKLFVIKPEILYAVDLDSVTASYFYHRLRKTPYIYDAHEYFTELPELEGRTYVQKVWKYIEKKTIPRAYKCLTVNAELANIYEENYNRKFLVVQNSPPYHTSSGVAKEKKFIYQGALNKGRGVEELIRMMKFFPSYTLDIAGDGPLRGDLDLLLKEQEIDNVVFHGMLKAEELRILTQRATLGFNLLLGESLNYYYSLANKFFDYVMAETPVVTMDFPVYRRLLKEHKVGIVVSDLQIKSLTAAVEDLLENETLYINAVKECEKAKGKWNWSKETKVLNELIQGL